MRHRMPSMRSYWGRAKSYAVSLPKTAAKSRYLALIASTALVSVFAASVVALRTMGSNEQSLQNDSVIKQSVAEGKSSSTQIGDQPASAHVDVGAGDESNAKSGSYSTSVHTNNGHTTVTVNNEPVAVPSNGEVHKVVADENGSTTIDVSTSQTGTGTNISFSSNTIQTNTNTFTQNSNYHSP